MGITGLWQILNSTSRPVTPESLENQILAVDVSIWMNQAVKGVRERRGPIPRTEDAHLLVMFNRICKLLHYRIKPVFVFDGAPPAVKQRQLERRRRLRNTAQEKVQKLSVKLLENLVQQKAIGNAIGMKTGRISSSQSTSSQPSSQIAVAPVEHSSRDMFALPAHIPNDDSDSEDDRGAVSSDEMNEDPVLQPSTSTSSKVSYDKVDINSEDFKALPPEIRHEILTELQAARRKPSWKHIHQLPEDSEQFSSFQIKRLMKRSAVQRSLKETAREMNSRRTGAVCSQMGNKLKDTEAFKVDARKIASTENSHYLLLTRKNSKSTFGFSNDNTNDTDSSEEVRFEAANPSVEEVKLPQEVFVVSSGEDEDDLQVIDSVTRASLQTKERPPVPVVPPPFEYISKDADISIISKSVFDIPLSVISQQFIPQRSSHLNRVLQLTGHSVGALKTGDNLKEITTVEKGSKVLSPTPRKSEEIIILDSPPKSAHTAKLPVKSVDLTVEDDLQVEAEFRTPTKTLSAPPAQLPLRTPVTIAFDNESQWGNFSSPRIRDSKESSDSEDDFEVVADEEVLSVSPIRLSPSPVQEKKPEPEMRALSASVFTTMPEAMQAIVAADQADFHNEALDESFFEIDLEEAETANEGQSSQPELSVEELQNLQTHLETEGRSLYAEQKKGERMANSVSDQLRIECQELLRLFGIPYINSPAEAEAQCAYMNRTKQTHGTITDDSDVWAFGGRKVYKNFFNNRKYIECFDIENIRTQVGMTKEKIIAFALLTGSDYTEGIETVGGIRALEIMAEFGGDGVDSLESFKNWWDKTQRRRRKGDLRPESKLRAQLADLSIPQIFPDNVIVQAYLDPEVDTSSEKFTWEIPALDLLREYTRKKFGYKQQKSDELLLPIIKRMNAKETQTRLESYFSVQLKRPKVVIRSKRLGNAIDKMKGGDEAVQDDEGALDVGKESSNAMKKKKPRAAKGVMTDNDAAPSKPKKPKAPTKRARADTVSSIDSLPSSQTRPKKRNSKKGIDASSSASQYFQNQ